MFYICIWVFQYILIKLYVQIWHSVIYQTIVFFIVMAMRI
jgi:hypothetical protein